MTAATHTALVERQLAGFNSGTLEDVVDGYADDVRLVLVSPHTLPGSELVLEGREAVTKHMGRVLKGGIADVELDWMAEGPGFIAWRDHGVFWGSTPFSESHTAKLNAEGRISEHVIHSLYLKP
jgi:hypothetical protein